MGSKPLGALPVIVTVLLCVMAAASAYYLFFVPEKSSDEQDGPPMGFTLLVTMCVLGVLFAAICELGHL